jgi:hypothetical protein
VVALFHPLVVPDGAGHGYLAEDYEVCERARRRSFPMTADTGILL